MNNTSNNTSKELTYQLHCPTPESLKTAVEYLYKLGYSNGGKSSEKAFEFFKNIDCNWLTMWPEDKTLTSHDKDFNKTTIDFDFLFTKLGKEKEIPDEEKSISDDFSVFVPDNAKVDVVNYLYSMGYSNVDLTLEQVLSRRTFGNTQSIFESMYKYFIVYQKLGGFSGARKRQGGYEVSLDHLLTKLPKFEKKPREVEVLLNANCRVIVGKEKVRVVSPEIFEFPVSVIGELIRVRDEVKDVKEVIPPHIASLELYCPDKEIKRTIIEFACKELKYNNPYNIDTSCNNNYLVFHPNDKRLGGNAFTWTGKTHPKYMVIDFNFVFTQLHQVENATKTVKLNDKYTAKITNRNIQVNCQVFELSVLEKLINAGKQVS